MNPASNGQSASAADDRAGPQRPYPAAPWKLHGRALISAWRVPLADLPRQKLGLCAFRPETTVIGIGERMAVRGLLTALAGALSRESEDLSAVA